MTTPVLTLWSINVVLKFFLLIVLIWNYHHVTWPAFTRYIFFSAANSLARIAVHNYQTAYYWTYNIGGLIDSILMFIVASELCCEVFTPWFYTPKDIGRKMASYATFGLALCIVTSVALWPSLLSPYLYYGRLLDRLSTTFMFGVFAVMAMASKQLGIPWRRYAFGIGAGFIVTLSLEAATGAMLAPMLTRECEAFRIFCMMGFPMALTIWIWYFFGAEPERLPVKAEFLRQLVLKLTTVIPAIRLRSFQQNRYSLAIPEQANGEYCFGQTKGETNHD